MTHHHHDDQNGDEDFTYQGMVQGIEGFMNESCAVIKGDDLKLAFSTVLQSAAGESR